MSAKDYAIKLLSMCDRSEKEIRDKLSKRGYDEGEIESVLDFCREYGYINDEGYARHFINDALRVKKWGSVRIKSELKKRGIAEEFFLPLLEETDERDTLKDELHRRFSGADLSDKKVKNRIFGYFLRRGYKTADILNAFGEEADYDGYDE